MWYLIQRFTWMLVILIFLSIALFALLSLMPGNPLDMLVSSNPHIKAEDVMRIKKLRGLDKPWYVQYMRWLWGYAEPAKAPQLKNLSFIQEQLEALAPGSFLDISEQLVDPNYTPSSKNLSLIFKEIWPSWQQSKIGPKLGLSLEKADLQKLFLLTADYDPALQARLKARIEKESAQNLVIKGLFGAQAHGLKLQKPLNKQESLYFIVENSYGQQKLVHLALGSTQIFEALDTQIAELKKDFELDLNKFIADPALKNALSFKLDAHSPGSLSPSGIYKHSFTHDGLSALSFSARDIHQQEYYGAFDIEHGVVAHRERFSRGLLFFLIGDRNALGFSHTYKRPVYDLLFGAQAVCGDGRIDPGESCDDGGQEEHDGCSAHCFLEDQSMLNALNISIAGYIARSGRIANTISLMLPALIISLLIALPLGILSAYRHYSWLDYFINFCAFIGISLPVFWLALMMIYIFAEHWHFFPAGGLQTPGLQVQDSFNIIEDRLYYAFLPTIVLSIFYIGRWMRYMRSSMLEILPQDYIRTARAKGLSEKVVVLKHGFRNALIPVVTILAISIPSLFGGALLTETVFAWPGIGRLQYDAVINNDYYVAIIVFLISALLVMIGNFIADIIYVLLDPRIRKS